MVSTIICEVDTIMCDIGTINVRFYLLEIPYPHGYCKITLQIIIHSLFSFLMTYSYVNGEYEISGNYLLHVSFVFQLIH